MKRKIQVQTLIAVLAAAFMFSSCGNVDIVKRKYRPGFHVDITKKQHKSQASTEQNTADERTVDMQAIDARSADVPSHNSENDLSASIADVQPITEQTKSRETMKDVLRSNEFEGLSFKRQMRVIQNKLFRPEEPANSNTHWMAWVSFGTGLGASLFGLVGFIVAFFGVTLWPLAIILGAAAITFAILHSKGNYQGERFRKLGLLFGIIGAGLGILGMIIWIVWAVGGFGGRYWYR